jgi:hypothetical protein
MLHGGSGVSLSPYHSCMVLLGSCQQPEFALDLKWLRDMAELAWLGCLLLIGNDRPGGNLCKLSGYNISCYALNTGISVYV